MATASKEKRVDFLSDEFDPLTALYSENVPLPCPEVRPFNNLAEYENVMQGRNAAVRRETNKCQRMDQTRSDSMGVRSDPLLRTNAEREMLFRQMMQRAAKIKQDRMEFDPLIPDVSEDMEQHGSEKSLPQLPNMMLKGKQKSRSSRNVICRMKEYGNQKKKGPFSLLYRAVEERIRVKVWTRSAKQLRGYCKGYIVAFDRHWNLAMVDVDEVFSKPCLPRTPYPSCKALEVETGKVVMMLNEDQPDEETSENSMDASQSNGQDEDIDALALRLQMLKQELSKIPSGEESPGSGPENDATDGKDASVHGKERLTESNISTISQDKKSPVDVHTKTDKDNAGEKRIGFPKSVIHQEGLSCSDVSRPIDFGGSGDNQITMCSGTVVPVGGAGDMGLLGEGMGKLQVYESISLGTGEVILDEFDMEVGGYEEIGIETVETAGVVETVEAVECVLGQDVVQSVMGFSPSSASEELRRKSSKKHSKSRLEKEQVSSVELKGIEEGIGSDSAKEKKSKKVEKKDSKEKKSNKAQKKDSKKKLSKDLTTGKSVSVDMGDDSGVENRKKSKMTKKSKNDTSGEPAEKDKKASKAKKTSVPDERDHTKGENLAETEPCDSLAKVAGLVKIPTKILSTWKIPKKSSKKSNQDPSIESPIGKLSDNVDYTGTKSKKPSDKLDEKCDTVEHSGKTSNGAKSSLKIPKLSKKSDGDPLCEERSEGLSVTESSPQVKLSQLGTVQKDFGDLAKKLDSEVVEQGSGDKKVGEDMTRPGNAGVLKDTSQIGEISNIVAERLREVLKESAVSVARSPKVKPNSDVEGSKVRPKPVKALIPKPRKPSKTIKVVPVKQPDPVRERLKQAGELSAAHYLKGRLHERHVNKIFLRGDNVAMVNLL